MTGLDWQGLGTTFQNPALILLTIGAAALALAWLLRAAIYFVLRHSVGRHGTVGPLLERLRPAAWLVLATLLFSPSLPVFGLSSEEGTLAGHIVAIAFIGCAGLVLLGLMHGWADLAGSGHRMDVEDNLEARKLFTRIRILRRIGAVLIGVITLAAMLMTIPAVSHYGVSLFASAGVVGIVVGFAARPVLSNLLAGLQIALSQPIRIDDVVIVEGEWGWVEEITATYVVVRIWDWRRLIVPLTYFIEKPFQNWTRESASIIGSVFWEVDYTVPVEDVRQKLTEFLKDHALWDRNVANLQVTESRERTMQLRALMSARTSPAAWDLRCDIREKMIAWLQETHPDALPRIRAEIETPATPQGMAGAANSG